MEIKRSYCGLCHPRCGMLLHIENNKVVKITGDPNTRSLAACFANAAG